MRLLSRQEKWVVAQVEVFQWPERMVYVLCVSCGSERLNKDGKAPNGKQRYRCGSCGRRSRHNPGSQSHTEAYKSQILALYNERPSMRGIERATGVSRNTLAKWLKKRPEDAPGDAALSGSDVAFASGQ